MANRIIKESICYSDDIDSLTAFEETVFYRLIVRADDYGRLDARPAFLKSMLFVTKQGVTEKSVMDAVSRLASVGLVRLYEVDRKPFLLLPKWNLHQRIRDSKEKYPAPVETAGNNDLRDSADSSNDSPRLAATCGELPQAAESCGLNPNPNPNPNPKKESEYYSCSEQKSSEQSPMPIITLPLNSGEEFGVGENDVAEWSELYPAVDIMQCLRNMRGWLLSNPTKKKTARRNQAVHNLMASERAG